MAQLVSMRAPGKLMLAGEYAVLRGAPALVAATAPWGRYHGSPCRERPDGIFPGAPDRRGVGRGAVDTRRFYVAGRKSGAGSSACAAVMTAAVAQLAEGRTVDAGTLWHVAQEVHAEMVGRGSGADLAAVIHGGCGLFRAEGSLRWRACMWPHGATLLVVEGGHSADTREWIERFERVSESVEVADWVASVTACLDDLPGADPAAFGDAIAEAARLYRQLRDWLGADLYPPVFEACHRIGEDCGVPFKPSGAGGGDLAFFYCRRPAEAMRVASELRDVGIPFRRVRPARHGVSWSSRSPATMHHLIDEDGEAG